jgi:radical SAM family uncharacterized protein
MTYEDRFLKQVEQPARYVGGEVGEIIKDVHSVDLRVAFCFPDTYEIGMSHLGLQILYGVMNKQPWIWCERSFAPWSDAEALLRLNELPLVTLESGSPLSDMDVVAFTLQYELGYTNVLNMLSLGNIPLHSNERDENHPWVIAGGPCALNPEPLADFMDAFVIGDGEEATLEVLDCLRRSKNRQETFLELSQIPGVYVPSLYTVAYHDDGTVASITPMPGVPTTVERRILPNLDTAYLSMHPLVPNMEVVHERIQLELFRGCIRGCRFCQAGMATRPVRNRKKETLLAQGLELWKNTGYDEVALTSLSTSDYPDLLDLCNNLLDELEDKRVSLSLPSLRADSFSQNLMQRVQQVRKSGLTFAPEAGTQRLRDVINKNLSEEALLQACSVAFAGGWTNIKLYFMLGLPTETEEDILGISKLAQEVFHSWRVNTQNRDRAARVTAGIALFVPKPHTPFQWASMVSREEFKKRIDLLKANTKKQITNTLRTTKIKISKSNSNPF